MDSRTEIVSVNIDDNTTIKLEASMLGGYEDVGMFEKAFHFEDVTNAIETIACSILKTLEKVKPDKASVEFGVEVGVESGQLTTLLVKGSSTGNLKITLEWEREKHGG